MATVKVEGVLRGKVNNQSIAKHANDETKRGVIDVPAGINNGICQVVGCGFAPYKTGKDQGKNYFWISMIIQEPTTVATPSGLQTVKGLYPPRIQIATFTQKWESGEDTTEDENWGYIMNNLRLMGGDKFTAGAKTTDDAEKLAATINDRKPYVRFSTKKTKKDRVYTVLHGLDGIPKDYKGAVKPKMADNTGKATTNGTPSKPSSLTVEEPPTEEGNEGGSFNEQEDIILMGEEAQNGDVDARKKLSDLVDEYGLREEASGIDSWEDTAKLVANAMEGKVEEGSSPEESPDDDSSPDEPEKAIPVKGQVWLWRFKDSKTKKPTTKPMTVKILNVDLKGDTADLYDAKAKKEYKGKPFSELEPVT